MADEEAPEQVYDHETGWSFDGVLDEPGWGYVIGNLMHDGHLCANQIRVERVLIGSHFDPKTKTHHAVENFTLGSNRVRRIGKPSIIRFDKTATDPRGFYNPRFAVLVSYILDKVFGEEEQQMVIEQLTLFTPYGKDTAHEPGGILRAARIYPMIRFNAPRIEFGKKLNDPYNRITAIRVLFRMRFQVQGSALENMAGIFRDKDDLGLASLEGAAIKGPGNILFSRAEKPLISEVVGRGVIGGTAFTRRGGDKLGWDNIHQWNQEFKNKQEFLAAAKNDKFAPTPGLPYGVHQHWRWGEVFYKGLSGRFGKRLLQGGKQFGGLGVAGGPMIDPEVPDQLLEFGISQSGLREERLRKILDDPNGLRFDYPLELMLASPSTEPENISLGAALSTWIDITAYSEYINEEYPFMASEVFPFKGQLGAHGVFFAHESEDVLPPIEMPGSRKPMYQPGSPLSHRWRRP